MTKIINLEELLAKDENGKIAVSAPANGRIIALPERHLSSIIDFYKKVVEKSANVIGDIPVLQQTVAEDVKEKNASPEELVADESHQDSNIVPFPTQDNVASGELNQEKITDDENVIVENENTSNSLEDKNNEEEITVESQQDSNIVPFPTQDNVAAAGELNQEKITDELNSPLDETDDENVIVENENTSSSLEDAVNRAKQLGDSIVPESGLENKNNDQLENITEGVSQDLETPASTVIPSDQIVDAPASIESDTQVLKTPTTESIALDQIVDGPASAESDTQVLETPTTESIVSEQIVDGLASTESDTLGLDNNNPNEILSEIKALSNKIELLLNNNDVESKANAIIEEANRKAQEIIEEANRKAQAIIGEANAKNQIATIAFNNAQQLNSSQKSDEENNVISIQDYQPEQSDQGQTRVLAA